MTQATPAATAPPAAAAAAAAPWRPLHDDHPAPAPARRNRAEGRAHAAVSELAADVATAGPARGKGAGRGAPGPGRASQGRTRPGTGVTERDLQSPSLTMLVLLATLGVLLYASFLLRPSIAGDLLPWLMVVVAELVLMSNVIISLWTQLSAPHDPRDFAFREARRSLFLPSDWDIDTPLLTGDRLHLDGRQVSVDVFVTTYGEPIETIQRTVSAAVAIRGEHRTWILDDGRSPQVRDLAEELGVGYLTRPDNTGAKAGNINHALSVTAGDYYVVLDADFVPSPEFLVETVPFFASADVAFVQTPQVYGNISNFISRGAGFMQSVFYSLIQPGKNRFNAAFCVGTNVVFRRRAIESIGGMYEASKSEDVWTSLRLHEEGWRSVYIPTVLAVGDTPENIEAYTKQQVRWATGAFEILFSRPPLTNRRLTVDQRLQYHGTATFYLGGAVTVILLLLPPLQIFLDLSPIDPGIPLWQWALYYSGFYVMQIVVAAYTIGSFRWETLLLSTVSFPLYVRALVNALLRKDRAWHVTGRDGRASSPFNFIVPQMLMLLLLLATTVVGIWKVEWTGELSIALIWNSLNTAALLLFLGIAAREARALRRTDRDRRREQGRNAAADPARRRAA